MTWKAESDDQNWNYLGYIASNVRSLLIPLERQAFSLRPRDRKYIRQGKKFFESAVAGCASYTEPERLFSVRENDLPSAATALGIAVEIYRQVHSTPPVSLDDFAATLNGYVRALEVIDQEHRIPDALRDTTSQLSRFLEALIEKANSERYRELKHDYA
ncbi:MAG: hypothetical protein HY682_11760 [Chloroflexi bacterium]|nr:hypothetical protein [Chloroflexota bacterium]